MLSRVDVIVGGFPCQKISTAGTKLGIDADGLWSQQFGIIRLLRPKFIVVENVSNLRKRGLGRVLGDLARSGHDAEWSLLSACSLGASHMRKRMFVVAYPQGIGHRSRGEAGNVFETNGRQDKSLSSIATFADWWGHEPAVARVANGFPGAVDRRRALGNAVVPQVAQLIAEIIARKNKGKL